MRLSKEAITLRILILAALFALVTSSQAFAASAEKIFNVNSPAFVELQHHDGDREQRYDEHHREDYDEHHEYRHGERHEDDDDYEHGHREEHYRR